MRRAVVCVLLAVLAGGMVSAWEVEDVNGTFVYWEEHMKSPRIHEVDYSWGKGLRITETTIDFDLGKNVMWIPGLGMYHIEKAYKDGEDSICLELLYVNNIERINMRVTFIDSQKAYITHDRWKVYQARSYSPDEKWVWYRLSGPTGN